MKNRKEKIKTIREAAKPMPPLTDSQVDFIQKYRTPGGLLILRNPDEKELQMATELNESGIDAVIIRRKIFQL
jgi:hypothetical protein